MMNPLINHNPAEMRGKIVALEEAMLAMPERQVQIETKHYFAPGLYMREILVPKDVTLVGKIQKTEYLNIVSAGSISVMTEAGFKRVTAPAVVRSHPGLKRAGVAHEDTVWLTVHQNPTDERDIDKLEEMLFADTFDDAPAVMNRTEEAPVITLQGRPKDYINLYLSSGRSFDDVLSVLGVSRERVRAVSENLLDQTLFPVEPDGIAILDSPIQGKGVFSTKSFKPGEILAPARIGGKRTPAGRYGNHGGDPNAVMVMHSNGDVDLVALKSIEPGAEVLSDYYFNYVNTRTLQVPQISGGR